MDIAGGGKGKKVLCSLLNIEPLKTSSSGKLPLKLVVCVLAVFTLVFRNSFLSCFYCYFCELLE